ncbi:MAG: FtsW/RodA/SpoVE family cell cycle protein [Anaerolineae bacterium]|nr:FtsW/RodA/SpoVE family cell cycle protein [Anaerolineae bacterium]
MIRKELWRNFDFLLFGGVLLLGVMGVVIINSATAGSIGLEGLPQRQMQYLLVGLVVIVVVSIFDYHYFAPLSPVMYIVIVGLLIFIFAVGNQAFGSRRWFAVGGINVQPSELARPVLIMVLANYFQKNKDEPKNWGWLIRSLVLVGIIFGLVVIEPDLSSSIVLLVIWGGVTWLAGLPPKYIVYLGLIGILIVAIVLASGILPDYMMQRIINFVAPDEDASYGEIYNIEQALITIGSGGWFGQGYQQSSQVQLRFQKVRHTDFIFSVVAAEFGLVGASLLMAMLLFIFWRCFVIAKKADDLYGSLIAYGIGIVMAFQTVVNIGVNLNLLPVTGLTLPFVSYGGSSMLSLCLSIGLVQSVAVHTSRKQTEAVQ